MTPRAAFAIPGDLASLTGGYGYDRELLARASRFGVDLRHLALSGSFPAPDAEARAAAREALKALPPDTILLADGLAYGAFTPDLLAAIRGPVVALCHHPLALESGLAPERVEELAASERRALARAQHVVVPSAATRAALVADYGVAESNVTIAPPGTDPAPRARGGGGGRLSLLAVGSVVPRKNYDGLVAALEGLAGLDWTLTVAGSLQRAPGYVESLRGQVVQAGLADRVRFVGEVTASELAELYAAVDVFVLASHFEGYGMVLGEAMARGLPIVVTTGGAAGDTVPNDAALKVPAGDTAALSQALAQMIQDAELRGRLASGSFIAGRALPTWDDTAARVASVLRRVFEEHVR